MAHLEHRIATFVRDLDLEVLGADVQDTLRLIALDCLAAILASVREDVSHQTLAVAKRETARGPARVLGFGDTTSVEGAALVNGVMAHAAEYDDIAQAVWGHATAPVVPAVLAVAEWKNLSGRDFLLALLAGIEVACKIGRAVVPAHYERGWHSTGSLGVFGAAVGVAKALGLGADGIATALSIASSQSAALRANVGTGVKPLHVGFAARDGVVAARLAAAGVTASPTALSGANGFLAVMGEGARPPETISSALGKPFEIAEPGFTFKIYPSCGETHAAVDAALLLREKHGLVPDAIKRVRAGIAPLAATNLTYRRPVTPAQCKFSLEFCVSAALARGRLGLDEFEPGMHADPAVRAMLEKTEAIVHPDLEDDSKVVCSAGIVEIETVSGKHLSEHVPTARGSAGNPVGADVLEEKFKMCAARALGQKAAAHALAIARRIDTLPDVRPLVDALIPAPAR